MTTDQAEKSSIESSQLDDSKNSNDTTHSEPPISNTSIVMNSSDKKNDEISEAQLQKYTILEKCSKQYEIFFQVYLSNCVLKIGGTQNESNKDKDEEKATEENSDYFFKDNLVQNTRNEVLQKIDELFSTLKLNRRNREFNLQELLNQSLDRDSENNEMFETTKNKTKTNENLKILNKLLALKLDPAMKRTMKFITQLLVTLATIPNYDQTSTIDYEEEKNLPHWIKVLSIIAAFSKADKELQIICISTLFELIEIVKFQKEKKSNRDIQHLVMLPILKYGHVIYIENQTRIFQVLVSTLWDHLDIISDTEMSQIALLLYRIHGCLDSGIVEKIISDRIGNAHLIWSSSELVDSDLEENDDRLSRYKLERLSDLKIMLNLPDMSTTNCNSQLTEKQYSGFKKFELLWHLGRDQKESFDKILLKMYDNLALSHHSSIRTFMLKWLKESLLRGDLERLLKPLLKIMLNPNTKRISISNAHLLKIRDEKKVNNEQVFDENKSVEDNQKSTLTMDNEVYVIKMEDGVVRNHLESMKKKSPIASIPKKILNIATKNSSIGDKMREKGLLPSAGSNIAILPNENDFDNMELFVNPLEQQEKKSFVSKSAPSSMHDEVKKFTMDTSSEYSTTSAESLSEHEVIFHIFYHSTFVVKISELKAPVKAPV